MNNIKPEKENNIETILEDLKPVIKRMLIDAPEWGTVGLSLIFNNGIIKRFEISSNKSILLHD